MKLLTFLLRMPRKFIAIPDELYMTIQSIAAREGLLPCELIARLVEEAESEYQAAEDLPARWERLTAAREGDRAPGLPAAEKPADRP